MIGVDHDDVKPKLARPNLTRIGKIPIVHRRTLEFLQSQRFRHPRMLATRGVASVTILADGWLPVETPETDRSA
jgi:hypothetical protein